MKKIMFTLTAIFMIAAIIGINVIINVYADEDIITTAPSNNLDEVVELETSNETVIVEPETTEETETPQAFITYEVAEGDSLWSVSSMFYKDGRYFEIIALYNNLENNGIHVGDTLRIPIGDEFTNYRQLLDEEPVIHAGDNREYVYGKRMDPAVDITPNGSGRNYTEDVDTSSFTYLGEYHITGYTPGCEHCCGNTEGITASGNPAINGYTVATASHLPFGTTLYIEGYGFYIVEDRGNLDESTIDIAADTHEDCYNLTGYAAVYIVD